MPLVRRYYYIMDHPSAEKPRLRGQEARGYPTFEAAQEEVERYYEKEILDWNLPVFILSTEAEIRWNPPKPQTKVLVERVER